MPDCTCADDWRAIKKENRIILEAPGAVRRENGVKFRDPSKIFVFDKNCEKHGYKEIADVA